MRRNKTFFRKVVYFSLIAALLLPLSYLSRPTTRNSEGRIVQGGLLSQMRQTHKLSQAQLGKIDPTSESVKLATLGLRGLAANLLWERANYFKKVDDWDNLKVTLEQMIKLQPNYVSVWKFQAWNLAYNVSVEFDDYRQRYHWVKKGIAFLMDGMDYNEDSPRLLWDAGWFFGHKLGRSDEKYQYRRMFKTDEDFHEVINTRIDISQTLGPLNRYPDSWLVSHAWFSKAQEVVDTKEAPLLGQSPLIFHSDPAMVRIRYAEAIEGDGFHGEVGQRAWKEAGDELRDYGDRQIPSSWGFDIRLNEGEQSQAEADRLAEEFEKFLPGLREEIIAEKVAKCTAAEQEAYRTPVKQRTDDQHSIMQRIKTELEVSNMEVADRAPESKRAEAQRLAFELNEAQDHATTIRRYRSIVNFEYWRTRCEVEQTETAVSARKFIYDAKEAQLATRLEEARELYEKAWDKWAIIFKDYPSLMDDVKADDLMDAVKDYGELVEDMEETFPPKGFKLLEFYKLHDKSFSPPAEDAAADSSSSNDDSSEAAVEDNPADDSRAEEQETIEPETGE